jgi:myo-inositol-1(or 4)-monophosphatase
MESLLDKVVEIARQAGTIALNFQKIGFKSYKKGHNDVVTEADFAVNNFLKQELMNLIPDAGWLSEESVDEEERLQKKQVWIIDPIDGTIQFAKGSDQWCISIALVENQRTIIGVIYNPRNNEMFFAERCIGAFLNDIRIDFVSNGKSKSSSLLTTKAKSNLFQIFKHGFQKGYKIYQCGSIAYILALISLGKSNFFITFKNVNEWDIAAGSLLLKEAGYYLGIIGENITNSTIKFNRKEVSYTKGIYGGEKDIVQKLQLKLT